MEGAPRHQDGPTGTRVCAARPPGRRQAPSSGPGPRGMQDRAPGLRGSSGRAPHSRRRHLYPQELLLRADRAPQKLYWSPDRTSESDLTRRQGRDGGHVTVSSLERASVRHNQHPREKTVWTDTHAEGGRRAASAGEPGTAGGEAIPGPAVRRGPQSCGTAPCCGPEGSPSRTARPQEAAGQ